MRLVQYQVPGVMTILTIYSTMELITPLMSGVASHLRNMMKLLCLRLQCLAVYLKGVDFVYHMWHISLCRTVQIYLWGLILGKCLVHHLHLLWLSVYYENNRMMNTLLRCKLIEKRN
nr:hypothetical protein Iba_chr13dCG9560 [Ipomoea batatas]